MSTVSDAKTAVIGKPLDRVDGRLKVTGQALYSAEHQVANLAYGYVVQSTIARGTIKEIDTSAAEKLHGVTAVFTYKNKPMDLSQDGGGKRGPVLFLLQDNQIHFAGQIIGLVVADTLEVARHAASLVKVSYDAKPFETDLNKRIDKAKYTGDDGAEDEEM